MKTLKCILLLIFLILIGCETSIEANPSLYGNYLKFSEADGWEKNTYGEFIISAGNWNGTVIQNELPKKFGGLVEVASENSLKLVEVGRLADPNDPDGGSNLFGKVDKESLQIRWLAKDGKYYWRRVRK